MAIVEEDRERAAPAGPDYRAFLLRCWQEPGAGPDDAPAWRFALLQLDGTEIKRGFASLQELCAHLCWELGGTA